MITLSTDSKGNETVSRGPGDQPASCYKCGKQFKVFESFIIHGMDGDCVCTGKCFDKLESQIQEAWDIQDWDV